MAFYQYSYKAKMLRKNHGHHVLFVSFFLPTSHALESNGTKREIKMPIISPIISGRCSCDYRKRGIGLCPGVPVHRRNNYCTPFFANLCLAVAYFWVFCIGSCVPVHVHEDRTRYSVVNFPVPKFLHTLFRESLRFRQQHLFLVC